MPPGTPRVVISPRMSESSPFTIRAATDRDALGLIALIARAFAEYPGCILDVEREEPDLLTVATAYARHGGNFWVALDGTQTVVGSVGWAPTETPEVVELKKLYVSTDHRRHGLASQLLTLVEEAARGENATGLELWSDTRFSAGHHFYTARGFEQTRETRKLYDISHTTEYRFYKPLTDR